MNDTHLRPRILIKGGALSLLLSLFSFSLLGCKTTQFTNDQFSYEIGKNRKDQTKLVIKLPNKKTRDVGLGVFVAEFTKPIEQMKRLSVLDEQATLVWEIVQQKKNEELLLVEYGTVPKRYQQTYPLDHINPQPLESGKSYLVKIETETEESEMEVYID